MLSVIHTAVKKWIGKMGLTTSKTLIRYRILILSISSTTKKHGQKYHHVEERERGYNGMKCNSDSCSPWRLGNSCHLILRLIGEIRSLTASWNCSLWNPNKKLLTSWSSVGRSVQRHYLALIKIHLSILVWRANTQNPLLLCLVSNRQTTYKWGNLLKRCDRKS